MTTDARVWGERADAVQRALGAPGGRGFGRRFVRGAYRNTSRPRLRQAFALNYWWIAHLIEVRVDAFERSGDPARLDEARKAYAHLVRRNHGRLENDYFDDMGWLAIAALRLHEAGGSNGAAGRDYLADAVRLQRFIAERGWNDLEGPSVSWRIGQPAYKNAPSNGAFAIVSARLAARTGDGVFAEEADAAIEWMRARLLRPDHLVADGVNRLGDHHPDTDWLFTYNQGLFIGALVERDAPPAEAVATARAALAHFAPGPSPVIQGETADLGARGGGDLGLFKGVLVRYLGDLAAHLADGADRDAVTGFIRGATDALWTGIRDARGHRAGDDWSRPAPPVTFLSTQLSAAIALETRARLDVPAPGVSVSPDHPHGEPE